MPAVERRVLDALGHDRTPRLLEPDREVGDAVARAVGAVLEEHERQQRVEDIAEVRPAATCHGECGLEPLPVGPAQPLVGSHVGAVDLTGDEQLDDRLAQLLGVVVGAGLAGATGEALDLGAERELDDVTLRGDDGVLEVGGATGVAPRVVDGLRGGRVDESGLDHAQGVVAGRARARPVGGQALLALEDLLDPDRGARPAGRCEPLEVAGGVREPVGVVDAEAVDHPCVVQLEQQPVRRLEDVVELDAHGDEPVDLEEAAVVEPFVLLAPVGQPVVLPGEQVADVLGVLAAEDEGEDVVAVADDWFAVEDVAGDRPFGHDLADAPAEHGQRYAPTAGLPVDVEPVRGRGVAALGQQRPDRAVEVLGCDEGHVVGHDVDDDAEPVAARVGDERLEALSASEVVAHPAVVDDVVAVRAARGRLEDRREVEVADAEVGQTWQERPGVGEGEPLVQLEPVGAGRRAAHDAQP